MQYVFDVPLLLGSMTSFLLSDGLILVCDVLNVPYRVAHHENIDLLTSLRVIL